MKLEIKRDSIPPRTLGRLVFIGTAVGTIVLFLPALLLGAVILVFSDTPGKGNLLLFVLMVFPMFLVLQAWAIAYIVRLGLWVYRWFKPIEFLQLP